MPRDVIELLWQCPSTNCKTIVPGLTKECPKCGRFRTEEEADIWPGDISHAAALKDEAKIKAALAGSDWRCAYCGASGRADDGSCVRCGSEKKEGSEVDMDVTAAEGDADGRMRRILTVAKNRRTKSPTDLSRGPMKIPDLTVTTILEKRKALGESSPGMGFARSSYEQFKSGARAPIGEDAPSGEFVAEKIYGTATTSADLPQAVDPFPPTAQQSAAAWVRRQAPPPADTWVAPSPPLRGGIGSFLAGLTRMQLVAGGVGASFFLIGLLVWWLFHTRVVDVEVKSAHWQRVVHVERYAIHGHDGFDPPSNAFEVNDLGQRVHHHDHVRVGSHTEHYTERVSCGQDCRQDCRTTSRSCTSNKNGSATCTGGDTVCSDVCTTKYCNEDRTRTVDDYEDQPRYREYYSWKAWEWAHERDATVGGTFAKDVAWPTLDQHRIGLGLAPGQQERESGRDEAFDVTFFGDGDTWTYRPQSVEEFAKLPVNSVHRIAVNNAGSVRVLQPGEKP